MNFKKILEIAKEHPYLEGKQQAIKILVPSIGENRAKNCIKKLTDFDPTSPKNKYIELFSRIFKNILETSNKYDNEQKEMVGDKSTKLYMEFINQLRAKKVFDKLKNIEEKNISFDLQKIKTFEEFIEKLNELTSKITKSSVKKGIRGLVKGKDYLAIPLNSSRDIEAYIPLTYDASKIIASFRVGNCEGKWCTAYQKSENYWKNYIHVNEGILVYIIIRNEMNKAYSINEKQAIYFIQSEDGVIDAERFDENDKNIEEVESEDEIRHYVENNWDEIRNSIPKPKSIIPKNLYYVLYTAFINARKINEILRNLIEYDSIKDNMLIFYESEEYENMSAQNEFIMAISIDGEKLNKKYKIHRNNDTESWEINDQTITTIRGAKEFYKLVLMNNDHRDEIENIMMKGDINSSKIKIDWV